MLWIWQAGVGGPWQWLRASWWNRSPRGFCSVMYVYQVVSLFHPDFFCAFWQSSTEQYWCNRWNWKNQLHLLSFARLPTAGSFSIGRKACCQLVLPEAPEGVHSVQRCLKNPDNPMLSMLLTCQSYAYVSGEHCRLKYARASMVCLIDRVPRHFLDSLRLDVTWNHKGKI